MPAIGVRGPFIEYECTKCGRTVQENAPRDPDRLTGRIAEANAKPETRLCAACGWLPSKRTRQRMRDGKVHRLGASENGTEERRTLCGMWGWRDAVMATEYNTSEGKRFEALDDWRGVTCKRCLARNVRKACTLAASAA